MPGDARRVTVRLTARSRALAKRIAPQIDAVYRELEALIGADLAERFYGTLDELIGLLGERAPPSCVR